MLLRVPPSAGAGPQSIGCSSNDGKSAQVNKKPSSYKPHVIPQALHNRDLCQEGRDETKAIKATFTGAPYPKMGM